MHKVIIALVSIFFLRGSFYAQSQQGTVEMDAIAFVRDSGKVQVEIYYSILQGALLFEQKDDKWMSQIKVRADIMENGKSIASQNINKMKSQSGSKASLDSSGNLMILDGLALIIPHVPNCEAVLTFNLKDNTGIEKPVTIKREITIPPVTRDKFFFGGVELASKVTASSDYDNPFEKVGYIITPNPSKVFGMDYTKLNYYTELYIPQQLVASETNCEIITRVLDGQKHEMFSNSHQQALAVSTIPVIGSIDVDGLPTDSYVLEILVKRNGTTEASVQKVFFYDSGMKLSDEQNEASSAAVDEETLFQTSDISKMPELEVEEKAAQTLYLATQEQGKAFKKLKTIPEQQRFIFQFWREKDKEQGSVIPLAAYKAFSKRVDEANRQFTYQKTPGWKIDFGRIYIMYGPAEQITKELHPIDSKPYVRWEYFNKNIKLTSGSHAEFDFVDRQGGGRFTLVNSNVQGEVAETDWFNREARQTH